MMAGAKQLSKKSINLGRSSVTQNCSSNIIPWMNKSFVVYTTKSQNCFLWWWAVIILVHSMDVSLCAPYSVEHSPFVQTFVDFLQLSRKAETTDHVISSFWISKPPHMQLAQASTHISNMSSCEPRCSSAHSDDLRWRMIHGKGKD